MVPDAAGQERMVTESDLYGTQRWSEPSVLTTEGPESVRVSAWAVLGLVLAVVGLCAALTGLLAPEGAVLGALGFLSSIGGLIASRQPAVAGRGMAGLAIVVALAAVALAVLAMSGRYSWPNSRTDEISPLHTWLVGHWALLGRW